MVHFGKRGVWFRFVGRRRLYVGCVLYRLFGSRVWIYSDPLNDPPDAKTTNNFGRIRSFGSGSGRVS